MSSKIQADYHGIGCGIGRWCSRIWVDIELPDSNCSNHMIVSNNSISQDLGLNVIPH